MGRVITVILIDYNFKLIFFTGDDDTIKSFINHLHANELSLIVQIPIVNVEDEDSTGDRPKMSLDLEHQIDESIQFWMKHGADGIFLEGLEHFHTDRWIAQSISNWQGLLDRFGTTNRSQILMTSYKFAQGLTDNPDIPHIESQEALSHLREFLTLRQYSKNFVKSYK